MHYEGSLYPVSLASSAHLSSTPKRGESTPGENTWLGDKNTCCAFQCERRTQGEKKKKDNGEGRDQCHWKLLSVRDFEYTLTCKRKHVRKHTHTICPHSSHFSSVVLITLVSCCQSAALCSIFFNHLCLKLCGSPQNFFYNLSELPL